MAHRQWNYCNTPFLQRILLLLEHSQKLQLVRTHTAPQYSSAMYQHTSTGSCSTNTIAFETVTALPAQPSHSRRVNAKLILQLFSGNAHNIERYRIEHSNASTTILDL